MQWTEQRTFRQRDPRLRKRINNQRIACGWRQPWSLHGSALKMHSAFQEYLDADREEAIWRPEAARRMEAMR
jgi:hypothetical protein